MKYNQPYDQPNDLNAPFVNGDPRVGRQGSIPPAEMFEYPQRELVNFFVKGKLTPSASDLAQLCRAYQNGSVSYAADTGTANAIVVALDPVPKARVPGMTVRIKKSAAANTGAVTLDVGLGADQFVKMNGAAFSAGDLPASAMFEATWDGSRWQTTNFLGVQSTVETITNTYLFDIPYCVDTSNTSNTVTAPFSPVITSVAEGKLIVVKLNKSFTGGAVIINVNALPSINVKRGDGTNPLPGDGTAGQILLLEFDGTYFQIVNSATPAKPLPIMLADVKSLGTPGGTATAGAWRTRDLNTVVADPFSLVGAGLVSLSSNRFTLGAGKWLVRARSPIGGVISADYRLWNVTDGSVAAKGAHQESLWLTCAPVTEYLFLDGELDLTAPKTFEIQIATEGETNTPTVDYGSCNGVFNSWTDDTGSEIYTVVWLTKVS